MKTADQPAKRPYVLVQNIIVTWTKRQRTSEHARLRAQLPFALPLPERAPLPPGHVRLAGNLYYHSLYYSARDAYHDSHEHWDVAMSNFPETTKLKLPSRGLIGADITCRLQPEELAVEFAWARTGRRRWLNDRRETRTLTLGQWLQLRFNLRVPTWDDPYYEIHILNIGYADEVRRTIFIDQPPTHDLSEWNQLY